MPDYQPVIGFEVHAELATASKVFCSCGTNPDAPANTQVCPVCLGFPGALPVLNAAALELSLRAALALDCRVSSPAYFERKNYYYPDLPKNYQISQKWRPFGTDGRFDFLVDGALHTIGIVDVHLEEDAGKLLHSSTPGRSRDSLVDYNRAGVPLLEIVSAPEIHSLAAAEAYMSAMRRLLQYLGVSEARMERGQIRFEANVSVRPSPDAPLGKRVEMKNLNSFRTVLAAIEYELERQAEVLDGGGEVAQETRLWDEARGITLLMRSKEDSHDYRYFPDPDLVPMTFADDYLAALRASLPETPAACRARFVSAYALPEYDADILTAEKPLADFVDAVVALSVPPKAASNWTMTELLRLLNESGKSPEDSPVTPSGLAALIALVAGGKISNNQGKQVFAEMFATGKDPADIAREHGFEQTSDADFLSSLVAEVIAANPDAAARYAAGEDKVIGFLVGQVMKSSRGKANAALVNDMLRRRLRS